MRVLTLDDMETRHYYFRRWFAGFDLVETYTAKEAITALDNGGRFDLVMLDHDLAESHYLTLSEGLSEEQLPGMDEYEPGTGLDVARHIATMPKEKQPGQVVVHSWNPGGSAAMHETIYRAGIRVARKRFDPDYPIIIS
jgi:CheY-like chemotaxis protein